MPIPLLGDPLLNRQSPPPPERILYVDDEREAREAFACAAHELGFRVDTADGGGEALTKASQNRYAVIATDLRMPTLNGLSLIQLLRPKWPEASYLIVTGASHLDLPRPNGEPLVDEIVAKPWKIDELSGILNRAIERYRGRALGLSDSASDELPVLIVAADEDGRRLGSRRRSGRLPRGGSRARRHSDEALDLLVRRSFRAGIVDLDRMPLGGLATIQRSGGPRPELPLVARRSSRRRRAPAPGDWRGRPGLSLQGSAQRLRAAPVAALRVGAEANGRETPLPRSSRSAERALQPSPLSRKARARGARGRGPELASRGAPSRRGSLQDRERLARPRNRRPTPRSGGVDESGTT